MNNKLGPNPTTDKILSWESPIVDYKPDTDFDKVIRYIESLDKISGWDYIKHDEYGVPRIDSKRLIKEIEELIKTKLQ